MAGQRLVPFTALLAALVASLEQVPAALGVCEMTLRCRCALEPLAVGGQPGVIVRLGRPSLLQLLRARRWRYLLVISLQRGDAAPRCRLTREGLEPRWPRGPAARTYWLAPADAAALFPGTVLEATPPRAPFAERLRAALTRLFRRLRPNPRPGRAPALPAPAGPDPGMGIANERTDNEEDHHDRR